MMDTNRKIDEVVDRVSCEKHEAGLGDCCWSWRDTQRVGVGAVCNARARKAGFTGKISKQSLNRGYSGRKARRG